MINAPAIKAYATHEVLAERILSVLNAKMQPSLDEAGFFHPETWLSDVADAIARELTKEMP